MVIDSSGYDHRMVGIAVAAAIVLASVNPYLEKGRELYVNGSVRRRQRDGSKLARKVPTNSLQQTLEILDLIGRCYVASGQRPRAEEAFTELLRLAPEAEMDPGLSPKILEVFSSVKSRLYRAGEVTLSLVDSAPRLRLKCIDPWRQATSVVLRTRTKSSPTWRETTLDRRGDLYVFDWSNETDERLWYAEARGRGRVVATLGSAEAPNRQLGAPALAAAPVAASRVSARRAGMYVSVGVALTLAVAGAVLWTASRSHETQAKRAEFGDTASALHAQAVQEQSGAIGLFVGSGLGAGTAGLLLSF